MHSGNFEIFFFLGKMFINSKVRNLNLLQSRILAFQCTCCTAPTHLMMVLWKSSKVKVPRTLVTAFFIFSMSSKWLPCGFLSETTKKSQGQGLNYKDGVGQFQYITQNLCRFLKFFFTNATTFRKAFQKFWDFFKSTKF